MLLLLMNPVWSVVSVHFYPIVAITMQNMRKEATLNVLKTWKELENLHSATFLPVLDPIFAATFRQLCDEEMNVRSAFLGLISFCLKMSKGEFWPVSFRSWISFLSLASSHIKPEIERIPFDSLMSLWSIKRHFLRLICTLFYQRWSLWWLNIHRDKALHPHLIVLWAWLMRTLNLSKTEKDSDLLCKPLFSYVW